VLTYKTSTGRCYSSLSSTPNTQCHNDNRPLVWTVSL